MATHVNGFVIVGAIEQKWHGMRRGGFLGLPLGNERATRDDLGRMQQFQGGYLLWHPAIGNAWEIHGLIAAHWHNLGREAFGYPIIDEWVATDGTGRFNHFRALHIQGHPERSIFWHPDHGAHGVLGHIRDQWIAMGWEQGPLGYPKGDESPTFDGAGRWQGFQNGIISWHESTGAHAIQGAISAKWWDLSREEFGYPITEELATPDGVGRFNHFRALHIQGHPERSIYWHPAHGAHGVLGHIRDRWIEMGWERSSLGYPRSGESPTFDGEGRWQAFENGIISWHESTGAHAIRGVISAKWWDLGREEFGYPITNEMATPDGVGRFNHFKPLHLPGQHERSIYWHPDIGGAFEVHGYIRNLWSSLGWERSPLGYPISGERDRPGGGKIQDFQNGSIGWLPGGDAFVEVLRKRRILTTPTGTALGGWAELELRRDGTYRYHGLMHNRHGFDPYSFSVRASAGSTTGIVFAIQRSGTVEGTISDIFGDPDREFSWDESEPSPAIQAAWPNLRWDSIEIGFNYEDTGFLGVSTSLLTDLLHFLILDLSLGPQAALIFFIGTELGAIYKNNLTGPGGVAGVVLAGGTSFLIGPGFAVPVFIGGMAVTNAMIEDRKMNEDEYRFAKLVFGDTLPPRGNITLTNLEGAEGRPFTAPGANDGVILNLTKNIYAAAGGPMFGTRTEMPGRGETLIHEMAHAWQLQRDRFIPGFIYEGLDSEGDPPPSDTESWEGMNLEEKAKVASVWFRQASAKRSASAIDWATLTDLESLLSDQFALQRPYFRHIIGHFRAATD